MFANCPDSQRLRSLGARRSRARLIAASATLLAAFAPGSALAGPGNVEVKSVFAMPVDATVLPDASQNERFLCTPEPNGRQAYGTQGTFNPAQFGASPSGLGQGYPASAAGYGDVPPYAASDPYVPANMPSSGDLTPALQAGASNDLCFGFTLTPNMQPSLVLNPPNFANGKRLQDEPASPNIDATHVATAANGDPIDNDDMDNVIVDLPTGFAGDPDGGATCSLEDFGFENFKTADCADNTQVGTSFVRISTLLVFRNPGPTPEPGDDSFFSLPQHLAVGGAPNLGGGLEGGQVFNLEHGPNELARLGVSVTPVSGVAPAKFTVRLILNPDGSGRLRTITEDAPRRLYLASDIDAATGQPKPGAKESPMYVESLGLRAWGSAAEHPGKLSRDFMQFGTDCSTPLSANVAITTYGGVKSEKGSTPFTMTGCDDLPFEPSVKVETTERRPAVPTGATVTVDLKQSTSGPRSALLKDAAVTLPAGLEIGAQAGGRAGGLKLCTAAQFGVDTPSVASDCPEATRAGEVQITTPLLSRKFVGHVYLGEQSAVGELPNLYIEVTPEGATAADAPRIKLEGTAKVDAEGRLTTTFLDAPQLRFSQLKLTFPAGPNALFTTPRQCGTTTSTSELRSSAKPIPVSVESSLTIDQDCDLPAFAPSLTMSADDLTAGASSPTTVRIARPDRSPWLKDINVSLPSGFLADLKSATECPAAAAATGACPASSRIATVTNVAGAGDSPLTLEGQMFLSERQGDDVAGGVIVVRAKIGDLDLGDVVVPARMNLRLLDAGLVLTTSAPLRFKGLALNLREITVRLDRPGFPLNPTACGPLTASASIVGDGGQTAAPTSDVNYAGCGNRPLQPGFAASLSGDTKPGGHPDVRVTLTPRPGDTNLRSTLVTLPAGVATDLKNVQVSCSKDVFIAGGCPAETRVGSATANVSITSDTITGDVYLVKVAGETLPGIGMSFTGRYAQRVMSVVKINPQGRLITRFDAIPDLPMTKLDLVLGGGPKGPIQLSPKACTANSSWDASFGGQGGQTATATVPFPCEAANVTSIAAKMSRKAGLSLTIKAPEGQRINYAKVTMLAKFRLQSSKTVRRYLKVKATGGKAKGSRSSGKTFKVSKSGTGPKSVAVKLSLKGIKLPAQYKKSGLKSGTKVRLRVRVVLANGKVRSQLLTVKAR